MRSHRKGQTWNPTNGRKEAYRGRGRHLEEDHIEEQKKQEEQAWIKAELEKQLARDEEEIMKLVQECIKEEERECELAEQDWIELLKLEEERANLEKQVEEIRKKQEEAEENLNWEQKKFTEQMKTKEQSEKERLAWEAEIESLQKFIAAEKVVTKRARSCQWMDSDTNDQNQSQTGAMYGSC